MISRPKQRVMEKFSGRRIGRQYNDIIECALKNDFRGVDQALEADPAVINAQRDNTGITALMGASGRGLERMTKHLLGKQGIDISIRDDFGNSAVDHARPFPTIIAALICHSHPDLEWQEPGIFLV